MDFDAELASHVKRVEEGIARLLPSADLRPARIHTAMRYCMQPGGKRLRPVLVLAAAGGAARSDPVPAAVAIECVHTYSLIHDDLPCMDDDDLRRGRPTAHRQFDEATAVLAGDALLTLAFELIGRHYRETPALAAALTLELADAAGSERLIGGQMADLLAERKPNVTSEELEFIHLNKTAAMIEVSLVAGGLCAGVDSKDLALLREAGRNVGLAFQIIDDILDNTADTATLGKTAGKDARAGKATFVALHGIQRSREFAAAQSDAAVKSLERLSGDHRFLIGLIRDMQGRVR